MQRDRIGIGIRSLVIAGVVAIVASAPARGESPAAAATPAAAAETAAAPVPAASVAPPATGALAAKASAPQSPAEELFARKCSSCHTVGKGIRVGPDLKDVNKRRSLAWMASFIKSPSTMLDTDPDARALLADFKGVRMPDLGLADTDAKTLADLLVRCSVEPCNLAGRFVPVTTATDADVARGRDLFYGRAALKNGAAPCVSCHMVRGTAKLLGGGMMAKDLTNVFARLGDEGLDTALASPAFPLMNRIFAQRPLDPTEVFAIRSFLHRANLGQPGPESIVDVPLVAVLGALAVLLLLNAAWARRLRGVRKPLVSSASHRGVKP